MTAAAERPTAPAIQVAQIPADMQARDQWLVWSYEWLGGKWTKVPYRDRGRKAATDNPATWHPFADAVALYERHGFDGIGFVFTADDPYCGIDIDGCFTDGDLTIKARTIIEELDSWAEITPSGSGVHVICLGALPGKGRKSVKHHVELYDQGRFFTVTGRSLPGAPAAPQPRQDALDALHARLFPPPGAPEPTPPRQPAGVPADDQIVLDKARAARNGALFDQLWRGDVAAHGGDESSADLALCNLLAFWCGPDPARIDRLFRASGLYRTKWERASYREPTIAKALEHRADYYDWTAPRGTLAIVGRGKGSEGDDAAAPDATDPQRYALTDTGNAELFAALYADRLRYDHRRGAWFIWRGHWWALDDTGEARLLSKTIATKRAEIAEDKAAIKWAHLSQSRSRRDALLSQAADEPGMKTAGADWDADPLLFGAANGVIDLATGRLHAGRPLDHLTLHSPVAFDPDARAPRWERFLAEVFLGDTELIEYVQRFAGYSLTGATSEHKLVIAWGKGSNGKSTLLNALAKVAGDYGYAMPFSTVEAQRQAGGPTNDLAALAGRRLVVSSEVNEGQALNEARIKSLTGGDPITARFLNREFFTFRPAGKFWLAVNHKPRVRDDSRGFWRRVDLLPFLASFEGAALDKGLEDALWAEASGILAWMVRGCLAWQAHGLGRPSAIEAATREYQRESDPLGEFLAECCAEGDGLVVRANVLYHAYLDWANLQGLRDKELLTSTRFGRIIGDRFEKSHDRSGTFYRGVLIRADWEERKNQGPRSRS